MTPELATSVTGIGDGVSLTMTPGTPFAGTNVSFEMTGLNSGEWVEVTFVDPEGQEAGWVTDEDARASWTTQPFRADDHGTVGWVRYGAQDQPGDWSVSIQSGGSASMVKYKTTPFRLPLMSVCTVLGVRLVNCHSEQAEILFSDSVHFAMTVDMHRQLERAVGLLEERLGVRSSEVPVIHLVGSKNELDTVNRATGGEPRWEAGFFRSWGDNPGIYAHTDKPLTDVYNMLTHEYVHFLIYEISGGEVLPAWLNEGLAEYYAFEVGLLGERPQATVWRMLRSADQAREAAEAGNLFPLSELESQRDWNSRNGGERVSLQYSHSHMLVRYITESYGAAAPLRMVERIGDGETLASAVRAVASVDYPQLEQDFVTWLVQWDEPVRAESRPYIQTLDELLAARHTIRERREVLIKEWNLGFDRAASKAAMEPLVEEMAGLMQRLEEASTPESLSDLHEAALTYLGAYQEFINEDLKFFSTGQPSNPDKDRELRSILRIWGTAVESLLSDAKFVLNL